MEHRATQHDSPPTSPAAWQAWTQVACGASRRRTSIRGMGRRIGSPPTYEAAQAWISWVQAHRTRKASEDGTRPGWNGLLPAVALPSGMRTPYPRRRRPSSERDLPEGRPQRGSEVDQQFGRAKESERAGSTGRAGRSKEGKRRTYRFLMDRLLSCCSLQIRRSEQLRKDKTH
jgi:hypothetical protein